MKEYKNLYEYILSLSIYDINKMIEEADTEEEKYLFKIGLKTQILQKIIRKEYING